MGTLLRAASVDTRHEEHHTDLFLTYLATYFTTDGNLATSSIHENTPRGGFPFLRLDDRRRDMLGENVFSR